MTSLRTLLHGIAPRIAMVGTSRFQAYASATAPASIKVQVTTGGAGSRATGEPYCAPTGTVAYQFAAFGLLGINMINPGVFKLL